MLRPEMKLFEHSEFSSQALLLIRFQIFIFLRFRSGTRIPHPVSPSHSIQEILNIFRYFLIQVHFDKSEFSLKSPENRAFFILHRFNILLILHLTFPF